MAQQRLDKLLAGTGRWSRREAKDLIKEGRVLVDGSPARSGEDKADPDGAAILVDGEEILKSNYFEYDGSFWSIYYRLGKDANVIKQIIFGTQTQNIHQILNILYRLGTFFQKYCHKLHNLVNLKTCHCLTVRKVHFRRVQWNFSALFVICNFVFIVLLCLLI